MQLIFSFIFQSDKNRWQSSFVYARSEQDFLAENRLKRINAETPSNEEKRKTFSTDENTQLNRELVSSIFYGKLSFCRTNFLPIILSWFSSKFKYFIEMKTKQKNVRLRDTRFINIVFYSSASGILLEKVNVKKAISFYSVGIA